MLEACSGVVQREVGESFTVLAWFILLTGSRSIGSIQQKLAGDLRKAPSHRTWVLAVEVRTVWANSFRVVWVSYEVHWPGPGEHVSSLRNREDRVNFGQPEPKNLEWW